jgi:hypothetical protein
MSAADGIEAGIDADEDEVEPGTEIIWEGFKVGFVGRLHHGSG